MQNSDINSFKSELLFLKWYYETKCLLDIVTFFIHSFLHWFLDLFYVTNMFKEQI